MSEIKVNKISQRSGTAITLGNSGTDFQLPSGADIVAQSGSTITIAAGATITNNGTATGFGATGAVNWNTTAVTSSPLTAVSGVGYFINTSGGAITVNLPAGVAGAIISLADYTNTWQTNNVTITPNGTDKIGGVNANATLNTEGQSVTFVYVDATEGWKNVQDSTSNVTGNPFIVATGGTITTSGNCKIHTFTGPGTFTVSAISQTPAENTISYMVVGGGAAGGPGGGSGGGGGGAGGFREVKSPTTTYTASPLDGYPSAPNRITITATSYPITVGAGGANGCIPARAGSNSIFSTITSTGGGGGGSFSAGASGGSGGGGGGGYGPGQTPDAGGTGNSPPVSPSQGNNGGTSNPWPSSSNNFNRNGGGGGGAGAAGSNGYAGTQPGPCSSAGSGGNGVATSISGSPVYYSGGGGGAKGGGGPTGPQGGLGGGGNGSYGQPIQGAAPSGNSTGGTANTGGGGGAYIQDAPGYNPGSINTGGSGIVVIRYKYQ
jgi:hypothetical protein